MELKVGLLAWLTYDRVVTNLHVWLSWNYQDMFDDKVTFFINILTKTVDKKMCLPVSWVQMHAQIPHESALV